jgi:CyaY protein
MVSQPDHRDPDSDFYRLSAQVLASIEAQADQWLQDDIVDLDTHRTGGLLELAFPNGSKLIINTQPPLRELWLASKAGGFHFRMAEHGWVDTRDGADFFDVLSSQASLQAGCSLQFRRPEHAL